MIKRLITLGTLFFTILINAQMNALTENGDEVILYENNTWKYSNDSVNNAVVLVKNDELFIKDKKASFLVKSSKTNAGIWINPKDWTFKKSASNNPSEFNFNHKNLDVYGMLITEKMELSVESLAEIAYKNALEAAPDLKIIEKEYRNVNGLAVIMMKLKGTIQGVKFIYFGYYYSDSEGAYQFITYTSQNLFDEYKDDMVTLLNGLTEY